ncbi:MAG: sulfotransferase domain-containing protein [Gemmatimonadota bacterium]
MHADALICSHARSGGRWLRFLVAHYLAARHRLEIELTPQTVFSVVPDHLEEPTRGYPAYRFRGRPGLPLVAVCHQPYRWDSHRAYPVVFLARNPYDVVVSAFSYLQEKGHATGSIRDYIDKPGIGLSAWIQYMNAWAPKLLTHRDAAFLPYGRLDADAGSALRTVLAFIDHPPDRKLVNASVSSARAFRSSRKIRTGQEGNFWDHLQPEEIFEIQERVRRGLSDVASHLLGSMGVEVDPFPRSADPRSAE